MEGIAAFNKEARAELFLATADQKRLAAPAVEKDFWVCWVLKQIFADRELANLVLFWPPRHSGILPINRTTDTRIFKGKDRPPTCF